MKWFVNISTRTKLLLGFGMMLVFAAIVIVAASASILAIQRSQEELFRTDFTVALQLVELRSSENRARAQLLEMLLSNDRQKQRVLEQDIMERARDIDGDMKALLDVLKDEPAELKKLEALNSVRAEYRRVRNEQIALIYKGKKNEAQVLGLSVQEERYNKMRDIAKELGDSKIERANLRIAESRQAARNSLIIFALVGLFALVAGGSMTLFLTRIIAGPLNELSRTAEQLASGDLAVALSLEDRKDEVGTLKAAFSRTIRYLQGMSDVSRQIAAGDLTATVLPASDRDVLGSSFVAMIGNLRSMNRELQEGINVLASATSEILSSTTQVASGMSETAASVTETTATVEEVKQTTLLASEKSKAVSENAQKAAQVAQQGTAAVSANIEGINHIRGLMETVAEGLVKLSEQTQSIGEIIAAVNDLAQQSNLLSVNAAIEAAKAGEQGKGFTVVAQEIKSLADQSKQSTEQVRAILTEIQKATSAAVMSAEQVSKAVETGVKQAEESGASITNLAESVTKAAQASTQIAASSQQQLVGMEQVAQAMENIKQATQQNVAGMKQAEQAAHNLNELGQKLKELVGRYKVA